MLQRERAPRAYEVVDVPHVLGLLGYQRDLAAIIAVEHTPYELHVQYRTELG